MAQRGRPSKLSKFSDDAREMIRKVCELWGATDAQIAELCDVTEQTVNNWKRQDPDFFESLKNAKAKADANVEAALYKRACGFKRHVEKVMKDGSVTSCAEEVPPDPVSCIFWLKNRQPARWRDKQEHDLKLDVVPVLQLFRNAPSENQDDATEGDCIH